MSPEEQTKKLEEQKVKLSALASCALFALQHLKAPGSGMMLVRGSETSTKWETEHWQEQFFRALESVGITIDRDLLAYSNASKANRKRMLAENPALAAKLAAPAKAGGAS